MLAISLTFSLHGPRHHLIADSYDNWYSMNLQQEHRFEYELLFVLCHILQCTYPKMLRSQGFHTQVKGYFANCTLLFYLQVNHQDLQNFGRNRKLLTRLLQDNTYISSECPQL